MQNRLYYSKSSYLIWAYIWWSGIFAIPVKSSGKFGVFPIIYYWEMQEKIMYIIVPLGVQPVATGGVAAPSVRLRPPNWYDYPHEWRGCCIIHPQPPMPSITILGCVHNYLVNLIWYSDYLNCKCDNFHVSTSVDLEGNFAEILKTWLTPNQTSD